MTQPPIPLRDLCRAATPGPWIPDVNDNGSFNIYSLAKGHNRFVVCQRNQWHRTEMSRANAQLIARLSPEVVLAVYEALDGIVQGAVHPDVALRRVMVDLGPIRKALALLDGHQADDGAKRT